MKVWYIGAALTLGLLLALWRCTALQGRFAAEQAAHDATRKALQAAVQEGLRWKLVAEASEGASLAMQGVATACLARETEAETATREREAIMTQAVPVSRPFNDQQKVVDHATRRALVTRLNRPL